MKPVSYILSFAAAFALICTFFVTEHTQQVKAGYELSKLRKERDQLVERGRQLDFEILQAAGHEALLRSAERLGVKLRPPELDAPPARGNTRGRR